MNMEYIEENTPLSPLCTFKTGGSARFFCDIHSLEQLLEVLKWQKEQQLSLWISGKGSNVVFSDQGWPGLVIHFGGEFSQITRKEHIYSVQAGAALHTLVTQSVREGFGGLEKLAGIPGTIGGGIRMNAGAFGQELADTCIKVRSITPEGKEISRTADQCDFSYRHSVFCDNEEIIISADFALQKNSSDDLQEEMQEIMRRRKSKQPLQYPNAGSMYKRPPGNFAGALIEQSGLKGMRLGDAQVSELHANFLINRGKASAQDIYDLSEKVIQMVWEDHQIRLQKEVIFIGEFKKWPR
jgi:UDP-N-acetylmuramate dehydrogenase